MNAQPDPVLAINLLRSHLQGLADAGVPRVAMTPEARAALKHLIRTKPWRAGAAPASAGSAPPAAKGVRPLPEADAASPDAKPSLTDALSKLKSPRSAAAEPPPSANTAAAPSAVAPHPARASASPPSSLYAAPAIRPAPAAPSRSLFAPPEGSVKRQPEPPPAAPAPGGPPLSRAEKQKLLDAVKARAETAPEPRALGTLREKMVFATGNPASPLMFVGEAPGYDEERLGEPFVGKAGQLLDKVIKAMGLERPEVYISNICKFRPAIFDAGKDQGTGNRKPSPMEMDACIEFIREEISIIRPQVIVALGGTAAEGLLGVKSTVSMLRGKFHNMDGTPVMVTFHPSYLLRNPDLAEKRKLWEDMLKVMERLAMPINDKQRGFFLTK